MPRMIAPDLNRYNPPLGTKVGTGTWGFPGSWKMSGLSGSRARRLAENARL